MLYILTLEKFNNYNNKNLVGYDLIKKIDSIINQNSSSSKVIYSSPLNSKEVTNKNLYNIDSD